MRNLDIKTLRLFVAVCDCGNLKAAAVREHIEPSAISKRMALLEAAAGVQLLDRNRRGSRPTPEGRVLLEHARSVLLTLERAEADLAGFKGGVRGHVRLLASASAIAESLLDDLSAFMRSPEHRGIQASVDERTSREIVSQVREGVAALGVCWDNADFSGLQHQAYRTDQLVLAVPLGHPLAGQSAIAFEDTLGLDHVGMQSGTAVYAMLHRAAQKTGKALNNRVVVSSLDSAIRVVSAGLAVSIIPRQLGIVHAAMNRIVMVPLLNTWAERQFAICYRSAAELSPAAKRLLDFLLAQASAQQPTALGGAEPKSN